MKYDELIKTISEIINNDNIVKKGLTLVYELDDHAHKKMDEHLFYTSNSSDAIFEHKDMFEVTLGEVNVKFIKKDLDI
jgi:hypothetical protein